MKAYKFKAANEAVRALDVIINKRLYCADWSKLNDPEEGAFIYTLRHTEIAKALKSRKEKFRVCCLSKAVTSRLMWSHYASGFRGLAIEIELPDEPPFGVRDVTYGTEIPDLCSNVPLKAEHVLTSKHCDWKYEAEIRILHKEEYYDLQEGSGRVSGVIAGPGMDKTFREILTIICKDRKIPLSSVRVDNDGNVQIM